MLSSDPIISSALSPSGEWELFFSTWSDPQAIKWFPTGRLHSSPQYFRVVPTWTASLLPQDDQLPLFIDIALYREPIRQFIPTAIIDTWLVQTLPKLSYTMAHWRSRLMGNTATADSFWCLFYGTFDGMTPIQFDDQTLDQTNDLVYINQSVDSGGQPADGEGDPPSMVGWTLCLIHKFLTLPVPPADGPPTVDYHVYGAWSLFQPDNAPLAVFDPTVSSTWIQFINLLNFPPNYLTLTPWQP